MQKQSAAFKSFIIDYLSRHRNNINRVLHIIGIPLAVLGVFQIFGGTCIAGFFNLFLGYILQCIGHAYFEKNELGEWILIKKAIKKIAKR